MKGDAAVTIGLRTRERPLLLRRAIESVLAQTFTDWQLVLFNNGGDPAPVDAAVAEYAAQLGDRSEVIHASSVQPLATASNLATAATSREFFALHDDDDVWDPTFLERTVTALREADPEVLAVATQFHRATERINEDGTSEEISRVHSNPTFTQTSFQEAMMGCPAPPICLLFRNEVKQSVGEFDPSVTLGDDWEFLLRLLTRGRIEVIAEPLATRYERSSSDDYANASEDVSGIRQDVLLVRDRFTERPMREGEISSAQVALSISEADRENHHRINLTLDNVRELRLQVGDIDHRSKLALGFLEKYDSTLRALRVALLPIIALRRLRKKLSPRRSEK